jgi:two-component system chemotaxis response regulator CheY
MAEILLAHESLFLRTLLAALLEQEHTVAAEVTNGVEAVEVYSDANPDVAVLARSMPISDGIEACAELRNLDPEARVIICASDGGAVAEDAREAGAAELLVPPFQQSGVLASVDRALG